MIEGTLLPSREVFWNISFGYIVYILGALAVAAFVYGVYRHYRWWRLGKPEDRSQVMGRRIILFIRTVVVDGLGHRRFLREWYPGTMHLLIFWGCLILIVGEAIEVVAHYIVRENLTGSAYLWFSLIVDAGGIMAVAGILMAAFRRYAQRPERLNTLFDDGLVISMVFLVLVTGFIVEGLRQAATEMATNPSWAVWSPGGYVFALAFRGMSQSSLLVWHRAFWWFHAALAIGAIVYVSLAFSKLQHIVVSSVNAFFRNLGPVGAPAPIDVETAETMGVGSIRDFTWKQLLDLDACTNCGRCQDVCPAYASGKPLSPRKLIQDLKSHWLAAIRNPKNSPAENASALVGEEPGDEEIWNCTTCSACQEACPVYVEHIVKVLDLRRNLVLMQSKMPESAQVMLRNMQTRGHPWAGAQSMRLRNDWISGLDLKTLAEDSSVEVLLWAGCTAALVERNVAAAQSLVRVLKAAAVSFGVLGEEEACCGDPARRTGYEIVFQMMAERNVEVFKGYNVKKMVTICPHCYNTFKNEYPRFGGDFQVVHYTELLADLLRQGRLKLSRQLAPAITYHDSCYLGRYNQVYEAPREILRAISRTGLREMDRSRSGAFCCGGGGAHMWVEETSGRKINEIRVEDVLKTGAGTVATACPYCLQMLEEGIERKQVKSSLQARDIVELVEEAVEQPAS